MGHLDILDDPSRLINGDETSLGLCTKSETVLAPKKWRNIYEINVGKEKETITVLLFISATGELATPMIVYPYIRVPQDIANSVPKSWTIRKSESGWMKSETFYEHIANDLNNRLIDN